jgi:RimJ/RimL family protein N-acetyltransferase
MLRRRAGEARQSPVHDGTNGRTPRFDVVLRAATLDDAAAMGTVWLRAGLVGYEGIFPADAPQPTAADLTDRWLRAISEGRTGAAVMVACHVGPGQTVLGTVAAVPDLEDAARSYLHGLYVDPGHWGRGIGRALHDAALAHLRGGGHRIAALGTRGQRAGEVDVRALGMAGHAHPPDRLPRRRRDLLPARALTGRLVGEACASARERRPTYVTMSPATTTNPTTRITRATTPGTGPNAWTRPTPSTTTLASPTAHVGGSGRGPSGRCARL